MNHHQRWVLVLGSVCLLVMVLVPPWKYSVAEHRDIRFDWLVHDTSLGYSFILQPPPLYEDAGQLRGHFARFVRIDSARLLIQAMLVGSMITVLLAAFSGSSRGDTFTDRRSD